MTQLAKGPLRDRIVIEEVTETNDGKGTVVKTWRPRWVLWAMAGVAGGGETFASQRLEGRQQATFLTNRVDGITDKHRLVFNGKYHDITGIEYPPDGKQMTIHAFQRDA